MKFELHINSPFEEQKALQLLSLSMNQLLDDYWGSSHHWIEHLSTLADLFSNERCYLFFCESRGFNPHVELNEKW